MRAGWPSLPYGGAGRLPACGAGRPRIGKIAAAQPPSRPKGTGTGKETGGTGGRDAGGERLRPRPLERVEVEGVEIEVIELVRGVRLLSSSLLGEILPVERLDERQVHEDADDDERHLQHRALPTGEQEAREDGRRGPREDGAGRDGHHSAGGARA